MLITIPAKEDNRLLNNVKLFLLQKSVSTILQIANNLECDGHFKFVKTMSILSILQWSHKTWDIKSRVDGCLRSQPFRSSSQQYLWYAEMLELLGKRWGPLATNFIIALPNTKHGFDTGTTCSVTLPRRANLFKRKKETQQQIFFIWFRKNL